MKYRFKENDLISMVDFMIINFNSSLAIISMNYESRELNDTPHVRNHFFAFLFSQKKKFLVKELLKTVELTISYAQA